MMFTHVLWDFDGTLCDTYPCLTKALSEALKLRGVNAPDDEIYSLLKITAGHALNYYREKYGFDESLDADFRRIRVEYEPDMCLPYLGIPELLADVIAAGGYNYISTNRDGTLYPILEKQNLMHLFRDFATAEDGLPRKPDPAMIIRLIEKYSMDPEKSVIVGDRELDVVSGQRAGIKGLAYLDGSGISEIPCADMTARNIEELRKLLLG